MSIIQNNSDIFLSCQVKGNWRHTTINMRKTKNKKQPLRQKSPFPFNSICGKLCISIAIQLSIQITGFLLTNPPAYFHNFCMYNSFPKWKMYEQFPSQALGKMPSIQQGNLTETNYNHNLFSVFELIFFWGNIAAFNIFLRNRWHKFSIVLF